MLRMKPWKAGGRRRAGIALLATAFVLAVAAAARGEVWDFADGRPGPWRAEDAQVLPPAGGGLRLRSPGEDPKLVIRLPGTRRIAAGTTFEVTMSATAGQVLQLFWGGTFNERDSLRAALVADGRPRTYRLRFMSDATVSSLRLDPTNAPADVLIKEIRMEFRTFMDVPPGPFVTGRAARAEIRSGPVRVVVDTRRWQAFDVYVRPARGREVLAATSVPTDVVTLPGGERLDMSKAEVAWDRAASRLAARVRDAGGATWTLRQSFAADEAGRRVHVKTSFEVDADRAAARLPVAGLFAGNGSFGERKSQALFAGVEYLVDEPSSNELDVRGAKANRLTPDPVKITFPLVAVQAEGVYVGLVWKHPSAAAALFDSPGRVIGGKGHAMLLSLPAVGEGLAENGFLAERPVALAAGREVSAEASIIGGAGDDATAAVRHYLDLGALPPLPERPLDGEAEVALFADAYTRSEGYADGLFRHAVWPGFNPQPAADACAFLRWLAYRTGDAEVRARARSVSARGLERIPADSGYAAHNVSHIVPPIAPLMFGRLERSFGQIRGGAEGALREMRPDGTFVFEHRLAETHFEKQAVGYAGAKVMNVLRAARLLGDEDLLRGGLKGLDAMARFDGHVPRGAQTWEIPLHTPDIMGSGRACEAFLLGYDLTGKREYLERAKYWAWTGVPFVYLAHPAPGRAVGLYASIPVLGGTNWGEPFWIGLPVQWCGLTYAYPLYRLAELDPEGPWRRIAEGITVSGMQQEWPSGDPARGLFPDFFHIREQRRDGPKINPGGILANYGLLINEPLASFAAEGKSGAWITAPARIEDVTGRAGELSFSTAAPAWEEAYYVVIARLGRAGTVTVDGRAAERASDLARLEAADAPAWSFDANARRLVVKLAGAAKVSVR